MEMLLAAIVDDDLALVTKLLSADPALAVRTIDVQRLYDARIFHWIYVGDIALHLAAAGYRVEIARALLAADADPNSALNRRRSTPLHYASDGYIAGPDYNAVQQVETLKLLIGAGADINAHDQNGATPLHRAVRTRCASVVKYLLSAGSNPLSRNRSGSTPFHLAVQNTGRGGSGDEIAKTAQRQIIQTFLACNVSPNLRDGKCQTVLDCARSDWIRDLVTG